MLGRRRLLGGDEGDAYSDPEPPWRRLEDELMALPDEVDPALGLTRLGNQVKQFRNDKYRFAVIGFDNIADMQSELLCAGLRKYVEDDRMADNRLVVGIGTLLRELQKISNVVVSAPHLQLLRFVVHDDLRQLGYYRKGCRAGQSTVGTEIRLFNLIAVIVVLHAFDGIVIRLVPEFSVLREIGFFDHVAVVVIFHSDNGITIF